MKQREKETIILGINLSRMGKGAQTVLLLGGFGIVGLVMLVAFKQVLGEKKAELTKKQLKKLEKHKK